MSGGMANLMNKAKQWEEQDIVTLQEQKVTNLLRLQRNNILRK